MSTGKNIKEETTDALVVGAGKIPREIWFFKFIYFQIARAVYRKFCGT
jgi:hypothetical protein